MTLYFNNAVDTSLAELGNFWETIDCSTTPASSLPVSGDLVHLFLPGTDSLVSGVTVEYDSTFNGLGVDGLLYSSGALLTGWDSGTSSYYLSGVVSDETGWASTTDFTGAGQSGLYYISGVAKNGLDSNGNGWCTDDSIFYCFGTATGLGEGSGGTGWDGTTGIYYIYFQATTFDSSGTGVWNNFYYEGGCYASAWYLGIYYYAGVATAFDENGTGWGLGEYWIAFSRAQGWDPATSAYYQSGQPTTLSESGNGVWNGDVYINGVYGWTTIVMADADVTVVIEGNRVTFSNNGSSFSKVIPQLDILGCGLL